MKGNEPLNMKIITSMLAVMLVFEIIEVNGQNTVHSLQ